MKKYGQAIAVVGLQYGSEGKGAIASYLAPSISATVRIGASNAGHTVIYDEKSYVMRQLPCGWVNPLTQLVIGISAFITLPVLLREIEEIDRILPVRRRIKIDPRALVITDDQILRESGSGLAERISSTSSKSALGIGQAMADKVLRSDACRWASDVPELQPYLCDTVEYLNQMLERNEIVLFEGTQGFGLSIDHGHFPFTTSRDTTAPALFAGTGVNPYPFDVQVIGVARAYPIRVGGPSGPFDADSQELTWEEVRRRSGSKVDITERTSVTKSVRRVATFSWEQLKRSCMVNRPTEIALTFADHLDASLHEKNRLSPRVERFMEAIERVSGAEVTLVKTGQNTILDFNPYRSNMLRRLVA